MEEKKLFINGEWVKATDGKVIDDVNPADGTLLARVNLAGENDLELALTAAQKAFEPWSKVLAHNREILIMNAAAELERRKDEIAELLINETGSAWTKANGEVMGTVDLMRSAAGECRRVGGEVFAPAVPGNFSFSVRLPLGSTTRCS